MAQTANHSIPQPGRFRRALAATWAFLQAMESTSFDYTLDRIEGLEREVGRLKQELRQNRDSGGVRCTSLEGRRMSLLRDKIAVVTGGSSGIGLATAERFAEQGAYVFIAGRRQAELDIAVAQIGENVTGVKTDISNLDDLDRLYETVAKRGKIDVLFAGAAFVEKMMTPEATPEHFDKVFNTNARGTYFTVQRALPYLNDGASIILVRRPSRCRIRIS